MRRQCYLTVSAWHETRMHQLHLLGGGGCHVKDGWYDWAVNEKEVKVVSAELLKKSGHSVTASCVTQISGAQLCCQEDILPGIQRNYKTSLRQQYEMKLIPL